MSDALCFFAPPKRSARVMLLGFPHAGGGPSAYAAWSARLPGWLDLCAFTAPGREARLGEAPCGSWRALSDLALAAALETTLPLALYGHSLGAWLAFDVACRLDELGRPPMHLFVAAAPEPYVRSRPLPALDDASLLRFADHVSGADRPGGAADEMAALLLPALRADILAAASCPARPTRRLGMGATILGGRSDPAIDPAHLAAWRNWLIGDVEIVIHPGGHFFPRESRDAVIATLISRLRAAAG